MKNKPNGDCVIRTIAMPADANANGDIFGGWLLSQMDLGAGFLATRRAQRRCTTVAINSMVFHLPVQIGDAVSCYGEITKVGNTSMTIKIEAWATRRNTGIECQVTEGIFTYVAIDEQGKPTPVNKQ